MIKVELPPDIKQEQMEKIESKIILEFIRHGKRDKDDLRPDEEISLNQEGRQMSQEKGQILNPQARVSRAWGSQLKRAQETALLVMLPETNIDSDVNNFDELLIQKQGIKKLIIDKRLGYDLSGDSGKESIEAFKEKKYISHVIEKSDQLAIEMGDKISTTYTRHAANIAEIISRYSILGNNFNRLCSKQKDKYGQSRYEKFGDQLERYLGTHSGITEFFLAKIIEKINGIEKREEFINSLGGGFKETEGMRVEIINKGNEQRILICYKIEGEDKELSITKKILEEIIEDKNIFEKEVDNQIIHNE